MSDPKHLLDEGSEATELERELLRAGQGVGLSADDKQAVWASVALQCLPAAGAGAAGASAGKGVAAATKLGAGLTPLAKGLLFVAGLGGVSAGAYFVTRAPAGVVRATPAAATAVATGREAMAAERPAEPTPAIAPQPEPSASSNAAQVTSTATSSPSSAAPSTAPSTASSRALAGDTPSALRDESAAVLAIRSALRAGDARTALRLLEQARLRFPRGALGQEREALTVEALAKSGNAKAASRQAQAFLRAHPKSPYASDVTAYAHD